MSNQTAIAFSPLAGCTADRELELTALLPAANPHPAPKVFASVLNLSRSRESLKFGGSQRELAKSRDPRL
jgi:hypothetical protein